MAPVDDDEIPFVGYHNDEEMKQTNSVNGYSNGMPTSAQALVQAAAYRIDLDPSRLKVLLEAMKKELVTETWQLDYMDFHGWREMGFPVGLIASIRAVKEEEEQSEKTRNKNRSHRSEDTYSEYSSLLEKSKASLHDAREAAANVESGEDGRPKRRISDITMSERICFGSSFRGSLVAPTPLKPNVGSPSSMHLNDRKHSRSKTNIIASLEDMPPIAAHRRRSSFTRTDGSPRRPSREGKGQKQARRSSLTMPLCPSRCPSLHKRIDDPSDAESITLASIVKSKVSSENSNVVDHEKSMETIIAGNLGLGDDITWNPDLDNDELTNEEEKADDKKSFAEDGSASTYMLIRRYTIR